MTKIYNVRMYKLSQCWVSAPLYAWWDGRSFVEDSKGRFIKGKFRSVCSKACVSEDRLLEVFRKAQVTSIKQGIGKRVNYSFQYLHISRFGKPRRLLSDNNSMGCAP